MTDEVVVQEEEVAVATENFTPDFPISIAIIGAPSSGKEVLIQKFEELSASWFEENGQELITVVNPGYAIEELDQAVGPYGSYREHLWALFHRFEEERRIVESDYSFISSGTMVDNMAHAAVEFETVMLGLQASGIVTPDTEERMRKLQMAMAVMTFLFRENFRYRFAFYLPFTEKVFIPGQDEDPDEHYSKRIDAALVEAFNTFNLRFQILDQPTMDEKVADVFETIRKIMTEGVELPIQTEVIEEEVPADSATVTE